MNDIEKCDFKVWRPYVCGKINRIGNMSVIRLSNSIMSMWGNVNSTKK